MNIKFLMYRIIFFVFLFAVFSNMTVVAQRTFEPVPGGKYSEPEMIGNEFEKSIRMLTNYRAQPEWKINIAKRAYQVFTEKPDVQFADLVADKKFREISNSQNIKLLDGPMLGQVSETGASVWVRTNGSASVTVRIEDGKESVVFGPIDTKPEKDFAAEVKVTGLQPDKSYPYSVFLNDTLFSDDAKGVLHTVDPKHTRVVFGSCPHVWGLSNPILWDRVLSRNPDALLIYGDIAVQDRKFNFSMHRFDYFMRGLYSPWRDVEANLPVYVNWDDHDYYENDHWGLGQRRLRNPVRFTEAGGTNEDRLGIQRIFMNSWNNPSYGFENEEGGIFFRTRIGAADVIMTDNRYFRGTEGAFLGDGQMNWLEQQLLACKGPFIIITCGTLWSDYKGDGKDSWGNFDPEGRERILSFIEKNNIHGVLLLSGDWHGARAFKIPRPSGYSFFEFQPASLGGRGKHEDPRVQKEKKLNENWLYSLRGNNAFGELTFDTEKQDPTVTYRLLLDDGTEYYKLTLTRSQLTPNP